jgi:hypothetical protein
MVLSEAKNLFASKKKLLLHALNFSITTVFLNEISMKVLLILNIYALILLAIFELYAKRSLVIFELCTISILIIFFLLTYKNNYIVIISINKRTLEISKTGYKSHFWQISPFFKDSKNCFL